MVRIVNISVMILTDFWGFLPWVRVCGEGGGAPLPPKDGPDGTDRHWGRWGAPPERTNQMKASWKKMLNKNQRQVIISPPL